jgi:glycosyltransferase involved in cell wall biosynthesis
VLRQTVRETEIVVVFDGPSSDCNLVLPDSPNIRLVFTGRRGGDEAGGEEAPRTLGVREARGAYVGFLDDDDIWLPEKLERQLELLKKRKNPSGSVLVSSRAYVVDADGDAELVVPTSLISPHEPAAEYLFHRRRVRWGGALLHTSTLISDRQSALETPWKYVKPHDDWDWVLRLAQRPNLEILMADEPLSVIRATPGSVSRSANWRGSLEWAMANRELLTDTQWADLLLCSTAPYAKAGGKRWQAAMIGLRALRYGRPSLPALTFFALYQLGPTKLLTRIARGEVGPGAVRRLFSWS